MDALIIARDRDGKLTINGATVLRYEWANGELVLVTADGEYSLPMTFEQYLDTLEDA